MRWCARNVLVIETLESNYLSKHCISVIQCYMAMYGTHGSVHCCPIFLGEL